MKAIDQGDGVALQHASPGSSQRRDGVARLRGRWSRLVICSWKSHLGRKRVDEQYPDVLFVDASVYILLSPHKNIVHCFNPDQYCSEDYRKFNDNSVQKLAGSNSIIVDIQTVECTWTDPKMHSKDGGRCGRSDLCSNGIKSFFKTHWRL